jgi:hypothetical protein
MIFSKVSKRGLFFVFLTASFCLNAQVPSHRKPSSSAQVLYLLDGTTLRKCDDVRTLAKKLKNSIVSISGSLCIWDLKGGILDGKKQRGDGSQSENQEPLARIRTSLLIKNGFVRNNKNALTFYSPDSGVDRVTWLTVGEDAVATAAGAINFSLTNSEFINRRGGDKSVQLNEGKGAKIYDNLIYSGITCARVGESSVNKVGDLAEAGGNRFVGCDTAYHLSRVKLVIKRKDHFDRVNKVIVNSNGSKYQK